MNTHTSGVIADERTRIAELLYTYPDVSPEELAEIRNWFDRVATSLDVGLLAADPAIARQYRAYRAEHLDRLGAKDWLKAGLFVGAVAAVIGGIVLLMPA